MNSNYKANDPPGTLIYVGDRSPRRTVVTLLDITQNDVIALHNPGLDDIRRHAHSDHLTWIQVEGLGHLETISALGQIFGLHPLLQEDIANTTQRPKLEEHGDYLFISAQILVKDQTAQLLENPATGPNVSGAAQAAVAAIDEEPELMADQISLVVGANYLISFQETPLGIFRSLVDRLRENRIHLNAGGSAYLAYLLLDALVDSYFVVLEELEDGSEDLEDQLIKSPRREDLRTLQNLKSSCRLMRRTVWPMREVVNSLSRLQSDLAPQSLQPFLHDLYDHILQINESVESLREHQSDMMDIYLSSSNNHLSEIMKVLAMIATIFMPLSFIAGIYGMNFEWMPELAFEWAYPAVLLVMALVAGGMLLYFKHKKWF